MSIGMDKDYKREAARDEILRLHREIKGRENVISALAAQLAEANSKAILLDALVRERDKQILDLYARLQERA